MHNKSLHPTIRPGTRVALGSVGAATRAPCRFAGELNRYIFASGPKAHKGRPMHWVTGRGIGAGPSRATSLTVTAAGRPTLMPLFCGGTHAP